MYGGKLISFLNCTWLVQIKNLFGKILTCLLDKPIFALNPTEICKSQMEFKQSNSN